MKKSILKGILGVAIMASLFIGGNKMEAKAGEIEDFCAMKGITEEELLDRICVDDEFTNEYFTWVYAQQGMEWEESCEIVSNELMANGFFDNMPTINDITTAKIDMLKLVNKDRKANGAGNLAWNADLEAVARQRAVEVMGNVQTAEFEKARVNGDTAKLNEIIHKGYVLKENAIVSGTSGVTTKTANTNWINSAGHHSQRIKAEWTQYACASYTDTVTGMETWVEVFADKNYKGASTFDSARYAADYPDLAKAFGNDKNALYNHYITNGRKEGRKAYNTDGTTFK